MSDPSCHAENGSNIPYIYVVIAYRWNDQERHSYLVAANFDKDTAIKIAENACDWRGGKYSVRVYKCNPNDKLEKMTEDRDIYAPPYKLNGTPKLIYTALGHVL